MDDEPVPQYERIAFDLASGIASGEPEGQKKSPGVLCRPLSVSCLRRLYGSLSLCRQS
jgi:hypothetical protein